MPRRPVRPAPFPTREQLIEFIKGAPGRVGKREIARAFGIKDDDRIRLRTALKELEEAGAVERHRGHRLVRPGSLPDVLELEISGTDLDGELMARPVAWEGEGPPPRIVMAPAGRGEQPLGIGDRVLARIKRLRGTLFEGRMVRRITAGPARVLGVYERNETGEGRLRPTDRRQRADFLVAPEHAGGAEPGELVTAEILPGRPFGLKPARIVERLGSMADPRSVSMVAIFTHDIPHVFPEAASAQARSAAAAPLGARTDLRAVPLVTIDGEDARDFDDAVFAEPADKGGWHIIVAIADVAWYVRPGDALDREAVKRGNSVYFPDRVVPMLPEELSNGWCSLKPDEDRPCMAVHIWIDGEGNKLRHQFVRGLMRSAARLTYTRVQQALDGNPDEGTAPLLDPVLRPLYGAWKALLAERERRGTLELDLPERQVIMGEDGRIKAVLPRPRYDSHRLIEDFMIAANVAAAEQIEAADQPCMYRVHDLPAMDKLDALHDFLATLGINLPRGQKPTGSAFNRILERAKEMPEARLINEVVLRSQAQAAYSPQNIGHFGLALGRYAHFTSPIRRYADLLVHRALIAGLRLGEGGLRPDAGAEFAEIGQTISATERRAATAERDALNRFAALFMADRVGASFNGVINGVTRFGLFVTLDDTGADGLVPMSALPDDYYTHDEKRHSLVGRRFGATYRLGDAVEVRLAEVNPLTGSLIFQILGGGPARGRAGKAAPRGKKRR